VTSPRDQPEPEPELEPPHHLEQRIVDLELRYMREERLVLELNDVVAAQQRAIDELFAEVKRLREQLLAGVESPPQGEPPPHY
jgi:SlyX protein